MKRVVVIGASAGGVEALREVVAGLPKDFPAPVLVVLHIPAYRESALPEILSRHGPLPASHAKDGEALRPGRILVAPPDHHLLVERSSVAVKRGPKENRFRPSIDALFRSAAYVYGPATIGVVLSGALDDGTSGLWSIKRMGGISIVQLPSEARAESMPASALEQVTVDHLLPATAIGPALDGLVRTRAPHAPKRDARVRERMQVEVAVAADAGAFQKGIMELGELTPFTCPECHGALARIPEMNMARFRCHTGHAYTDSSLLEGVTEATGELLWQVMRSYEEAVLVSRDMARHLRDAGDAVRARRFDARARDLEQRSKVLHDIVLGHQSLSGDNV